MPFFAQEEHACGPASLASVLVAAGVDVAPAALTSEVYLPGRQGSLAPELLAAAWRHGRLAAQIPPTVDDLLAEIDAGHPVLVLLNLGLDWYPVWHFAVVTGYDLTEGVLHLHSGSEADAVFSLSTFERTWVRAGSWAMVVSAPGELPATVPYAQLLEASAGLERNDARSALAVWGLLSQRFPDRFEPWMGTGNSATALGDLARAREAFAQATRLAPGQGDAWNNLAAIESRLGHDGPAREAIGRALQIGGDRRATYEQTAAEIEQAAAAPHDAR